MNLKINSLIKKMHFSYHTDNLYIMSFNKKIDRGQQLTTYGSIH